MAEPRVVGEWVKKAEEDYQFAASVLEDSTFYAQICFHFHQAAEKYLKAFIVAWDLEFQKIHDLLVSLKICSDLEPGFGRILDDCKFLNRFYLDTRYPVHWPTNYSKEEAKKAKNASEQVRKAIRSALTVATPNNIPTATSTGSDI
jgi:HEPN domain-containing protein